MMIFICFSPLNAVPGTAWIEAVPLYRLALVNVSVRALGAEGTKREGTESPTHSFDLFLGQLTSGLTAEYSILFVVRHCFLLCLFGGTTPFVHCRRSGTKVSIHPGTGRHPLWGW